MELIADTTKKTGSIDTTGAKVYYDTVPRPSLEEYRAQANNGDKVAAYVIALTAEELFHYGHAAKGYYALAQSEGKKDPEQDATKALFQLCSRVVEDVQFNRQRVENSFPSYREMHERKLTEAKLTMMDVAMSIGLDAKPSKVEELFSACGEVTCDEAVPSRNDPRVQKITRAFKLK